MVSTEQRCGPIFEALRARNRVVVLEHKSKRGKGEALKTAFNYVLNDCSNTKGVITVDADGQHRLEDVLKVAMSLNESHSKLCLGVRRFNQATPLRSRLGNEVSRLLFKLIVGIAIADTQTGLRAVPKSLLPALVGLKASGYEFELEALMYACSSRVQIEQVPIEAVYLNANSSSHFNPILDSLKIYFVLFRFVPHLAFHFCYRYYRLRKCSRLVWVRFWGRLSQRAASRGIYNFLVVRSFVFKSKGSIRTQILCYAGLVFGLMFISYGLTLSFIKAFAIPPVVANAMSNTLLFFANFTIQRMFLFRSTQSETTQKTDWDAYYSKPATPTSVTRASLGHICCACCDYITATHLLE